MRPFMFILIVPMILVGAFVALANRYWGEVFGDEDAAQRKEFWIWFARGLGLPLFFWLILNVDLFGLFPPIHPRSAAGDSGVVVGWGWVLMASVWLAVTLAWLLYLLTGRLREEDRRGFGNRCKIWALFATPFALWWVIAGGWYWVGVAGSLWALPLIHAVRPLLEDRRRPPSYTRALASLKLGKYHEAEAAIIQELERCQEDFDGWMMLAEIYAKQFNDLEQADGTVRDLCNQPETTMFQMSMAFHRLADWHLRLGRDPVLARAALEEICRRSPGSHEARMALTELEALPIDREELQERERPRTLRLPALGDPLDDDHRSEKGAVDFSECVKQANRLVERLRRNPDDVESRERLAQLLAEDLNNVGEGIRQLELLLGMPGQPPAQRADWLSQLAAWQLNRRHDLAAARRLLERLVKNHAGTPQAIAARRRLDLLEQEEILGRNSRTKG